MRMSDTSTCGLVVFERGEHVARVGEAAHGELLAGEGFLEHPADRLIVVNDPDRLHLRPRVSSCHESGIRILKIVRPGTLSHSIVP